MSGRRAKKSRREQRDGATSNPRRKRGRSGTDTKDSRRSVAPGPMRRVVFLTLAAAVLATAGYLLRPALIGRAIPATAGVVDVAADMGGFTRAMIRVKAGEPVTIRLTSLDNRYHVDGGGKHQFAIDELGVNIVAPPLGSASETFTPAEPGTYLFYCDICCGGRANPTMSGELIVEA